MYIINVFKPSEYNMWIGVQGYNEKPKNALTLKD